MAQSKELKTLSELAKKQLKLEADVAKYEEKFEEAKVQLRIMREETFPEVMARYDLTDITIKGKKIELHDDFRCNFPTMGGIERAKGQDKERLIKRKREGIKWMKEYNHTGLLKSKVALEFGMGEYKMLEKFKARCDKSFPKLELAQSDSIHPGTLKKFLKELGENGEDYPKEVFGVFNFKRVEITA